MRAALLVLSALATFGIIAWRGLMPILGFDIWWQLAAGREMAALGNWLPVDTFSHTVAGQPWTYKDAGFSWALWFTYSALGWPGIVIGKALVHVLTFAALAWAIIRRSVPAWLALAAVASSYAASAFRFTERPQVISFLFLVVMLGLLDRRWTRELSDRRPPGLSWGTGLGAVALCWVNANMHRAGLLLPGVVAAFVLALVIHRLRQGDSSPRNVARFAGIGVLWILACGLVCLLNPSGVAIVDTSLAMVNDPLLHGAIPEWAPASPSRLLRSPPAIGVLLAIVTALVFGRRRLHAWDLVLLSMALIVGLRGMRFLPYLALFAALPVASALTPGWGRGSGTPATLMALAVAASFGLWQGSKAPRSPQLGPATGRYPAAAVDFVRRHQPRGAMYNDFAIGGYLIFELGGQRPDTRVFIDGRNDIVYPRELIAHYLQSKADPRVFASLADEYSIQWLFLDTRANDPTRVHFDRDPRWTLVHVGGSALIYVRSDGPNAELARELGYRLLRPHEISKVLLNAAHNEDQREAMLQEVRRALQDDPESRFAHVNAVNYLGLLGPAYAEEMARHRRWLATAPPF